MIPRSFPSFARSAARLAAAWCLLGGLGAVTVRAQDQLEFKNGSSQTGKITGVQDGNVLIAVTTASGSGQLNYNLTLLNRVTMAPPAAFQAGWSAYQAGKWDKALAELKPLTDQFRGLPVDWAQQAAVLLGDVYVEKKDADKAEVAYRDFRALYPDAPGGQLRASVGQARIAALRNNMAQAKRALDAIAQQALKSPALVTNTEGVAYGQAFYQLGQIAEAEHSDAAALESYLRTVTLFYQDEAVAARAQRSADALRSVHAGLTAP